MGKVSGARGVEVERVMKSGVAEKKLSCKAKEWALFATSDCTQIALGPSRF